MQNLNQSLPKQSKYSMNNKKYEDNAKEIWNKELGRIQVEGDNTDHIDTEKKSFRIKISNGNKIFGMSEFSVSHPKTRQFTNTNWY